MKCPIWPDNLGEASDVLGCGLQAGPRPLPGAPFRPRAETGWAASAGGTQLFVEPQLLQTASLGRVSPTWSPNQLAYVYAFLQGDFNACWCR